jgi:predicted nucleic acid-binding protein
VSFVLDASVTMSWLLADGKRTDLAYANAVLESLKDPAVHVVVPAIWALEVGNVIARAEQRKLLNEAQSEAFLAMLAGLGAEEDPAGGNVALGDTLQLARRYALSAYDASYLELALRRSLPLATLDSDLRKAATRAGVAKFAAD